MLSLIGVAKLIFGAIVAVVGITVAARVATRLGGFSSMEEGIRSGNAANGLVLAASMVAMGILVQHAVRGTFGALDLLIHAPGEWFLVGWVFVYATGHVAAALAVGSAIIALGVRTFNRLTPEVDEVTEIREGNVASALVLAAVLVVIALLAQQGVETMLDGLLPLPTLGRDTLIAPS
ncbi:MAG: DUF350 domain-containing protein [Gemmatimonadota bacterium]|nr:DUF350 domain-containing protein [Gemmatimonadota bacterium]